MNYEVLDDIREMGKSRLKVKHNCGAVFWVYSWSFAGCGKRCPECGEHLSWANKATLEAR